MQVMTTTRLSEYPEHRGVPQGTPELRQTARERFRIPTGITPITRSRNRRRAGPGVGREPPGRRRSVGARAASPRMTTLPERRADRPRPGSRVPGSSEATPSVRKQPELTRCPGRRALSRGASRHQIGSQVLKTAITTPNDRFRARSSRKVPNAHVHRACPARKRPEIVSMRAEVGTEGARREIEADGAEDRCARPMPSASVTTATKVNPGSARSRRAPWRRSAIIVSTRFPNRPAASSLTCVTPPRSSCGAERLVGEEPAPRAAAAASSRKWIDPRPPRPGPRRIPEEWARKPRVSSGAEPPSPQPWTLSRRRHGGGPARPVGGLDLELLSSPRVKA